MYLVNQKAKGREQITDVFTAYFKFVYKECSAC